MKHPCKYIMKFGIKAGIVRQNLLLSILLVFMLTLFQQKPLAQNDTFAPQLSNDLSFVYVFDDDFALASSLSYNDILIAKMILLLDSETGHCCSFH